MRRRSNRHGAGQARPGQCLVLFNGASISVAFNISDTLSSDIDVHVVHFKNIKNVLAYLVFLLLLRAVLEKYIEISFSIMLSG